MKSIGKERLDWVICYQSRVGPLKWIGPSTEDELKKAAIEKKGVVLVPIAFVSEHSETLVELDIEYKKYANDMGIPFYLRTQTVGTHPDFIAGLVELVKNSLVSEKRMCAGTQNMNRVCALNESGCINNSDTGGKYS